MRISAEDVCIVGIGQSQEFGFDLGKSPLHLQVEAFNAALEDSGLDRKDIDGFATAHGSPRVTTRSCRATSVRPSNTTSSAARRDTRT